MFGCGGTSNDTPGGPRPHPLILFQFKRRMQKPRLDCLSRPGESRRPERPFATIITDPSKPPPAGDHHRPAYGSRAALFRQFLSDFVASGPEEPFIPPQASCNILFSLRFKIEILAVRYHGGQIDFIPPQTGILNGFPAGLRTEPLAPPRSEFFATARAGESFVHGRHPTRWGRAKST